jgi:hypothetical protein
MQMSRRPIAGRASAQPVEEVLKGKLAAAGSGNDQFIAVRQSLEVLAGQ